MLSPSILAGDLAVDENAPEQTHRRRRGESRAKL
jgi:hypothetical protein